jgi:CRISPR-associated endoribonuclease Cas6
VLTVADSTYAHAAILHAVSEENPSMGHALHEMQRYKRITLALVESDRMGNTATLRLTFAHQDGLAYAETVVNALSAQPALRIDSTMCDIEGVDLTGSEWTGISTWSDLVADADRQADRHTIRLEFATPTAITKRDGHSGRFMSLFPTPLDVFSGLSRRWHALDGPALMDDLEGFVQTGGCVVSGYDLRSVEFRTSERTQIGFTGWVLYRVACRTRGSWLSEHEAANVVALNALGRLAFFTGVGYQTARGMGATQVTISK